MYFVIEMDPCQGLGEMNCEDSSVSEALYNMYDLELDARIFVEPQVWVRLPVSSGLGDIIVPVGQMLDMLAAGASQFEMSFLCSCFTAIWVFSESDGILTIETYWIVVLGFCNGVECRDAEFNKVAAQFRVEKKKFVAEWKKILMRIKDDLLSVGYGKDLYGFDYLDRIEKM